MSAATLLALVDATPTGPAWARGWLEGLLSAHVRGFRGPDGATGLRGWSVGTVLGDEPLAQSRPMVRTRDVDPLDDLLRVPGGAIVGALREQTPAPSELTAPPGVSVHRFRRWIGLRAQAELPRRHSELLRDELPEFLARGRRDRADGELVLLSFIAELQTIGGLRATYATAEEIQRALGRLDQRLRDVGDNNFLVTDGRTVGVLHRGGGTLLAFDAPADAPRTTVGLAAAPMVSPARFLLLRPGELVGPIEGAERIAEGCLTIDVRRPWIMQRGI